MNTYADVMTENLYSFQGWLTQSSLTRAAVGASSVLWSYSLRLNRPRRRIALAVLPLGLGRVKIP